MSKTTRRREVIGVVAVMAAVGAVAVGIITLNDQAEGGGTVTSALAAPVGADTPTLDVADVIAAGTEPDFLVTANVVDGSEMGAPKGTLGINLTATSPDGSKNGATLLPEWQAAVTAGALADSLPKTGSTAPSAFMVTIVGSDGEPLDGRGAAIPDASEADLQARTTSSDDELKASVAKIVTDSGWSLSSVEILRPLGPAVVVTAQAPEGKAPTLDEFSSVYRQLLYISKPETCELDGLYVELNDSQGQPLVKMADACRLNTGFSWNQPDGPIQVPHATGGSGSGLDEAPATAAHGGPATIDPTPGG